MLFVPICHKQIFSWQWVSCMFFLFMCNCLLLCKYVNTVNIYSADSLKRSNFVNTLYKLIMISVVKILAYIFDSYH